MIIDNPDSSVIELIESNAELKSFIQNIDEKNRLILSKFTHELRNPLTLVRSTIQLIENQHPEVKDFKYWDQLLCDIDHTVDLMNELSIYNHCDQLSFSNTNLYTFILSIVDSMRPFASTHNITISYDAKDNCDQVASFLCDQIKLKEVLINLIKNAIEAAYPNTSIIVDVSITETKTISPYIDIRITNLGNPIPTNDLNNIFEPFYTSKQNGSGLGLAISQKIVNMHGGQLTVSQTESAVTFALRLPTNVSADAQ